MNKLVISLEDHLPQISELASEQGITSLDLKDTIAYIVERVYNPKHEEDDDGGITMISEIMAKIEELTGDDALRKALLSLMGVLVLELSCFYDTVTKDHLVSNFRLSEIGYGFIEVKFDAEETT